MAQRSIENNSVRIMEPGHRRASQVAVQSGETAGLPEDLLRDQRVRIQVLHLLGVVLWVMNGMMDAWLAPHGDRGPYRLAIEGGALALAAAVAAYARFGRASNRVKIEVGVALVVPHAFALALLNSWASQPTTMRPLSGITVLVLLFGMLAPARPRRMLATALAAAAMDPLCVWIAHLRGLPVPSPLTALLLFYPNFVCAVLAVAPARILYRLGRQICEARALGSYRLVARLGSGGMGEVWLARHRLLARSAAIKLIRPEMLAGGRHGQVALALERFEREAQATAALTSPHTVRVFDFGLSDADTFYYVMELLDGRDLESLVQEFGPLPPARALHLVRQVCRSLAEAHTLGLIHRDVKPANIYVCRLGLECDFVKVLDFGLVRHEDRSQAPTMLTAPVAMGTPAYMAPEVVLGEPDVDRRADVYAVGCVMYFLLTGEHVFEATSQMKLLMQHVQDAPIPPSRRARQRIPRDVDDLVMACLHKDPDRRPQSAGHLLQLACECRTDDAWDGHAATAWWETHLPHLMLPGTGALGVPVQRASAVPV
jgi:serine/threonine-protein kinase